MEDKLNIPYINTSGNYVINTMVNAVNSSSNSFYINFDTQPTDPTMIWDIYPSTSGFQMRTVSWRGNGFDGADQYYPKVFYLTQGQHTLIIRGREANTKLDSITINPY